jgi:hypothetical protein
VGLLVHLWTVFDAPILADCVRASFLLSEAQLPLSHSAASATSCTTQTGALILCIAA